VESRLWVVDFRDPRAVRDLLSEIVERDWPRLDYYDRQELVSYGVGELIKLRDRYDPARGVSLESYLRILLPRRLRGAAAQLGGARRAA
jgi:DNA-directed RNA polymerase specialized sigma subunit